MKNKFVLLGGLLMVLFLFISGCGEYSPQVVLPDYVKTIAIETFSNKTAYYGMEEKLTQAVVEEFLREGRLGITDKDKADALLSGNVARYTLEPLSYDQNDIVEEYRLWMVVDIIFKDLKTGQILWEDKGVDFRGEEQGIKQFVRYYVTPKAGGMVETEEDARARLIEKLSEDIVRRIIRWQ